MDLLRRLHNLIRSRVASGDKTPADSDLESWPDFDNFNDGVRQEAEPKAESGKRADTRDPDLAQWYANLEIPYGSDIETAKKAWRKLMKRYHPDLHSTDSSKKEIANELTRKLTTAYKELEKRLNLKH